MNALVPVDSQVLANAIQALKVSPRFTNGVVRDVPWAYVPFRVYVYRERSEIGHVDSGLVEVRQYFGVEACFPFTIQRDGSSDCETLGDYYLAELETLLFAQADLGVNAELAVEGLDSRPLPQPDEQSRTPLAHATMLCVATYYRGDGAPYTQAATIHR